jgi:hypothetical protein
MEKELNLIRADVRKVEKLRQSVQNIKIKGRTKFESHLSVNLHVPLQESLIKLPVI